MFEMDVAEPVPMPLAVLMADKGGSGEQGRESSSFSRRPMGRWQLEIR